MPKDPCPDLLGGISYPDFADVEATAPPMSDLASEDNDRFNCEYPVFGPGPSAPEMSDLASEDGNERLNQTQPLSEVALEIEYHLSKVLPEILCTIIPGEYLGFSIETLNWLPTNGDLILLLVMQDVFADNMRIDKDLVSIDWNALDGLQVEQQLILPCRKKLQQCENEFRNVVAELVNSEGARTIVSKKAYAVYDSPLDPNLDDCNYCLELLPNDYYIIRSKIEILFRDEKYAEVLQVCDGYLPVALKKDHSYQYILYERGRALKRLGRQREALSCFRQVDELSHMANADSLTEEHSIFRELGEHGNASKVLESIRKIDVCISDDRYLNIVTNNYYEQEKKPQQLVAEGDGLRATGELSMALVKYCSAHNLEPKNIDILCKQGVMFFELGYFNNALEAFDLALGLCANNLEVLIAKRRVLRIQKKDEQNEVLLMIKKVDPKRAQEIETIERAAKTLMQDGAKYFEEGDYWRAVSCYETSIKGDPYNIEGVLQYGCALYDLGEYQKLIEVCSRYLSIGVETQKIIDLRKKSEHSVTKGRREVSIIENRLNYNRGAWQDKFSLRKALILQNKYGALLEANESLANFDIEKYKPTEGCLKEVSRRSCLAYCESLYDHGVLLCQQIAGLVFDPESRPDIELKSNQAIEVFKKVLALMPIKYYLLTKYANFSDPTKVTIDLSENKFSYLSEAEREVASKMLLLYRNTVLYLLSEAIRMAVTAKIVSHEVIRYIGRLANKHADCVLGELCAVVEARLVLYANGSQNLLEALEKFNGLTKFPGAIYSYLNSFAEEGKSGLSVLLASALESIDDIAVSEKFKFVVAEFLCITRTFLSVEDSLDRPEYMLFHIAGSDQRLIDELYEKLQTLGVSENFNSENVEIVPMSFVSKESLSRLNWYCELVNRDISVLSVLLNQFSALAVEAYDGISRPCERQYADQMTPLILQVISSISDTPLVDQKLFLQEFKNSGSWVFAMARVIDEVYKSLRSQNRHEAMLEVCNWLVAMSQKGESLFFAGNAEEWCSLCRKYHWERISLLFELGKYEECVSDCNMCLQDGYSWWDYLSIRDYLSMVLLCQAQALEKLHRYDDALKSCQKHIRMFSDDNSVKAYDLIMKLGKPEIALQVLCEIRMSGCDMCQGLVAQIRRCICELEQEGARLQDEGELSDALEKYSYAIKLDPANVDLLYKQGMLFLELRDLNNALLVFDMALKIDSKNVDVLVAKYRVLKLKKSDDAKEALSVVEQVSSERAKLIEKAEYFARFYGRARDHAAGEDRFEVCARYELSVILNADETDVLYRYIRSLRNVGDNVEALRVCTRCLRIDPGMTAVQAVRDEVQKKLDAADKVPSPKKGLKMFERTDLFALRKSLISASKYDDVLAVNERIINMYADQHDLNLNEVSSRCCYEYCKALYNKGVWMAQQYPYALSATINLYKKALALMPIRYLLLTGCDEMGGAMGAPVESLVEKYEYLDQKDYKLVADFMQLYDNIVFALLAVCGKSPAVSEKTLVYLGMLAKRHNNSLLGELCAVMEVQIMLRLARTYNIIDVAEKFNALINYPGGLYSFEMKSEYGENWIARLIEALLSVENNTERYYEVASKMVTILDYYRSKERLHEGRLALRVYDGVAELVEKLRDKLKTFPACDAQKIEVEDLASKPMRLISHDLQNRRDAFYSYHTFDSIVPTSIYGIFTADYVSEAMIAYVAQLELARNELQSLPAQNGSSNLVCNSP